MNVTVDIHRSAPATVAEGPLPQEGCVPGAIRPTVKAGPDGRDVPHGYVLGCPGCGVRLGLATVEGGWATSGDLAAGTLSLHPSIHHAVRDGGCGWHGYLSAGQFISV